MKIILQKQLLKLSYLLEWPIASTSHSYEDYAADIMCISERDATEIIESDLSNSKFFSNILSEAYDCVVKLSCPLLPRDCQLEIIKMLSSTPLPPSLLQNQYQAGDEGLVVKLLPQAKKMNEPSAELNTSIENEHYELRRSFDITFQLSNVDPDIDGMDQPMGPQCLFYFICAFGSAENYETFSSDIDYSRNQNYQAIYLAFKYRNTWLILYFVSRNDFTSDFRYVMFISAAEFGYLIFLKTLVEVFQFDPAAGAASGGHFHAVKYLMEEIEAGSDLVVGSKLTITYATFSGHLDAVKYLIEEVDEKYGIDPSENQNLAIRYAASCFACSEVFNGRSG